jgi:glutaredoxin
MKNRKLVALALALSTASAGAAQLYRWVDEQGRVEWRDTPPPAHAKHVEQRNVGGNTIETSTLPYSVQQAVRNFPVTLWVFDCGEPCAKARAHLQKRGVPYTERNAQKEPDALKKLVGGLEVPVLVVGSRTLKGYLESDWDAALDTAGYPKSAIPGVKTKPQAHAATGSTASTGAKSAPAAPSRAPQAR